MRNILFLLAFLASTSLPAQIVPAPTEKQAQAIEKVMAPLRKKVGDILQADKTGQNKTFRADMDALVKETDPVRHQELAAQMDRNHKAFVRSAFKTVQFDLTDIKRQVAGILGHNKFTMDEFGGINLESIAPLGPLPTPIFSTQFNCPLGEANEDSNSGLVAFNCKSEVDDCGMEVRSDATTVGSCRTKGSLGGRYELTGGPFTKTTVSAQSNVFYYGSAYGVAGYGQFNVKIGVRLQGLGFDKVTIVHENWCVAPVFWYNTIKFDHDNFLAQAVFSGNFASGNAFTAQGYAETFALGIGLINAGGGFCFLKEFAFVRATASN